MCLTRTVMVAVAAGLFAFGATTRAEDDKLPLDKVPAQVMKALKAKFPKAQVVAAEKGDQDGTAVYEFDLKDGDRKWEVSFTPDGKFVSSEEPVKQDDLPESVKEAFAKKYPDAKVVSIEKETTGEGDAAKVVFEIVVQTAKGKVEAQFDTSGKFIAEEKVKDNEGDKEKEKGKEKDKSK